MRNCLRNVWVRAIGVRDFKGKMKKTCEDNVSYVHYFDWCDDFIGLYTRQNLSDCILYEQFIVCQLYSNKAIFS